MASSSEDTMEGAIRAMNQRSTSRLVNSGMRFYKDHFRGKNKVVELVSDVDVEDPGADLDVWLGKKTEDLNPEADPRKMNKKKMLTYPLGNIYESLAIEFENRQDEEEEEVKKTKRRKKKEANKVTGEEYRRRRADSIDNFIVSDNEIDPPRRENKSKMDRERKRNIRKSREKRAFESSDLSETEESDSGTSKMGRGSKTNVTSSPKKGRGRPPKDKSVDNSPKKKETPSRKEKEKKTEAPPVRKGKKGVVDSKESSDDVQVVEMPIRKSGGMQPKNNGKKDVPVNRRKKVMESEESQDEPAKTKRTGRQSKNIMQELFSDKSDSEEESADESPKTTRTSRKDTVKRKDDIEKNKKRTISREESDDEVHSDQMMTRGRKADEKKRQGESRKRKAKETEESDEEDEDYEMSEGATKKKRSNGASTSMRGRRDGKGRNGGKEADKERTSYQIDVEKQKKNKQAKRRREEKRKEEESNRQVSAKMMANTDRHEGLRQKVMREDGGMDGDSEQIYYTARNGSRSRDGSVPIMVGTRSSSVAGTPNRSRSGSPIADERNYEGVVNSTITHAKQKADQLRAEQAEEERREEKRREKEKMKNVGTPLPPPPTEKPRIKPKVWTRGTRDHGIVDTVPPSTSNQIPRGGGVASNGSMRGKGRGGRIGAVGLTRTSDTSSNTLLDTIIGVMDRSNGPPEHPKNLKNNRVKKDRINPYPPLNNRPNFTEDTYGVDISMPPINVPPKPFENPTEMGIYRPDGPCSSGDDERRETRIEYRGGGGDDDLDDGMNGRRSVSMRRRITPMDTGEEDDLIDVVGNDSPPSHHSPIDDAPADIIYSAPASPDNPQLSPSDNNMDVIESDNGDGYSNGGGIPNPMNYHRKGMERPVQMSVMKDREKASTVLANIVENIWEDRFDDIIWALDLKLTNDKMCYFDRKRNRQFIIDLIKKDEIPSPSFFNGLHALIKWDNVNMDKKGRCRQSKLNMRWMNDQSNVHFAAAPIYEELPEGVTMRITALSEAIRLHKFDWVSFLLMKGAIVNERITYATFEGSIISLAIHMVASRNLPGVDHQNIIRILLSYGADRQDALDSLLQRRRNAVEQDASLEELHAFNTRFPYYADMEKLFRNACGSVGETLKMKMKSESTISYHFKVNWIRETVCSLPDKNYLIIKFDRHYEDEMRKNESGGTLIFAVIVGIGEEDVVFSHSNDPEFYRKHQIKRLETHHRGRPPFTLTPNVKLNDDEPEPEINRVEIDPIYNGVNIFIIPPALNERLYTLTINIDQTKVDFSKIIFAGLAQLSMINGERSMENIQKVLEEIRRGSVTKFHPFTGISSVHDIII